MFSASRVSPLIKLTSDPLKEKNWIPVTCVSPLPGTQTSLARGRPAVSVKGREVSEGEEEREGKGGRKEGMTFVECVSRIYTIPSQNDSDV